MFLWIVQLTTREANKYILVSLQPINKDGSPSIVVQVDVMRNVYQTFELRGYQV